MALGMIMAILKDVEDIKQKSKKIELNQYFK